MIPENIFRDRHICRIKTLLSQIRHFHHNGTCGNLLIRAYLGALDPVFFKILLHLFKGIAALRRYLLVKQHTSDDHQHDQRQVHTHSA